MSSSEQKPDLDRPLTIGHGKKLYDQSKAISGQVEALAPLLKLLDQASSSESDQDPIVQIIRLLETLTDHSQRHTALLQAIDGKLNFLLADSNIGER
jgi:hypothetical protein